MPITNCQSSCWGLNNNHLISDKITVILKQLQTVIESRQTNEEPKSVNFSYEPHFFLDTTSINNDRGLFELANKFRTKNGRLEDALVSTVEISSNCFIDLEPVSSFSLWRRHNRSTDVRRLRACPFVV